MRRSPVRFRAAAPKNQALGLGRKPGLFCGVTPGLHLPFLLRGFARRTGSRFRPSWRFLTATASSIALPLIDPSPLRSGAWRRVPVA